MDSITQGLLGAAATQALLGHRLGKRAWLYGAIGGMAPDLDIFIRSPTDPLIGWRFHRHFTHSVAFIPIGGVLASLPWTLRKKFAEQRQLIAWGTTIGYATHALLDAFTSYGTLLWWPFSQTRVAWSWVAIVDPIYSGLLLAGVILSARWAARANTRTPARLALLLSSIYLLFGLLQRSRAIDAATSLARSRGHSIDRIDAFASPPTNLVWRTIYASDGRAYVDGVRAPWWSSATVVEGSSVPLLTPENLPPAIKNDPATAEGYEVFAWFARGWVAWDPQAPNVVGDLRYGIEQTETRSMWGVVLRPDSPYPVAAYRAQMGRSLGRRWRTLLGDDPEK